MTNPQPTPYPRDPLASPQLAPGVRNLHEEQGMQKRKQLVGLLPWEQLALPFAIVTWLWPDTCTFIRR